MHSLDYYSLVKAPLRSNQSYFTKKGQPTKRLAFKWLVAPRA